MSEVGKPKPSKVLKGLAFIYGLNVLLSIGYGYYPEQQDCNILCLCFYKSVNILIL